MTKQQFAKLFDEGQRDLAQTRKQQQRASGRHGLALTRKQQRRAKLQKKGL